MGGNAFKDSGIITPRMPTNIYKEVLNQVEEKLSTLFKDVAHAIEGPEKTTHGDLDILFVSHADTPLPSVEEIGRLLGAIKWTRWQKDGVTQFALPWPSGEMDSIELSVTDAAQSTSSNNKSTNLPKKCVQLDLTHFPTTERMHWQLFNTSHGDLCNILSNIVRSKGLTINTEALHLRIASVEKHDRKAGRIELTRDPQQVLTYFGLNPVRFWQPFTTLDEMMGYAATSRFFQPVRQRVESADASMYWTDQKYLNVRPIFTYWIETYLPAHRDDPPGPSANLSREETLEDIFNFFGPQVRSTYETQKHDAEIMIARQHLWPNIRAAIRDSDPGISEKDMVDTVKAIKRVAQYNLVYSGINTSYAALRDLYVAQKYENIITWAARNHTDVLEAYRLGKLEAIAQTRGPDVLL